MTILLTECSISGIVMAADTTITLKPRGGRGKPKYKHWDKILRVPDIRGAVGYWGYIGNITSERFDVWLKKIIAKIPHKDLHSLANYLAEELNTACNQKPLDDDCCAGLHVAGYHPWDDGEYRPFFFHVNNGPGYVQIEETFIDTAERRHLLKVRPKLIAGQRTLFSANQEFPRKDNTIEQNLEILNASYTTRNGDFLYYTVLWKKIEEALDYLNHIEDVAIPKDSKSLGARKGLLLAAVETTIRVFKCSNQPKTVGGKPMAVAIGPDGYRND